MAKKYKLIQLLMALVLVSSLLAPAALQVAARPAAIHPALAEVAATNPEEMVRVIVIKAGSDDRAESIIEQLGGTIYHDLYMINAFAAELSARAAVRLGQHASVNWVTLDGPTSFSVENNVQEYYYLYNNPMAPAGDTVSQAVLPLDMNLPVDGNLFNYDMNRDNAPGLSIQRGGSGAFETDPAKIQRWRFPAFTEDYVFTPKAEFKFYSVMENFQPGQYGKVWIHILDWDGEQATLLASESIESSDWPVDWGRKTINIDAVGINIPAGHQLEIALTVDAASSANMWFAFGTVEYAAQLKMVSQIDWPVYYLDTIGAPAVWAQGYDGDNVRVAVVDSGVQKNIADIMDGRKKRVIAEIGLNPNHDNAWDNFGHGMYIHGLIGSNGAKSDGRYMGVAPKVDFLNIRVNDVNGMANESDVVAGLQWVMNNKDTYNIRVVNLSMNSSVAQPYHLSPMNLALEMLWFNDIVVVAAAGNNGDDNPGVLYAPANDPLAIVVGATDDMASADPADDQRAAFSAYGATFEGHFRPDLAAPGANLVSSMHSQTSFRWDYSDHVIQTIGANGRVNNTHFVASGTSAAAAVVSGAVALLLDAQPDLTPDQVKYLLMDTTTPLPGREGVGAGLLNIDNLVNAALSYSDPADVPNANQGTMPHMALAQMAMMAYWASQNGGETIDWDSVNWDSVNWDSVNWDSVNWDSVNWDSVNWDSVNWDSVNWDSVNWNSVNWNSVNWNSVNWNSVNWDSVNWDSVNWDSVNWNSVDLEY